MLLDDERRGEDHVTAPGPGGDRHRRAGGQARRRARNRGAWELFADLEIPLAAVLAKIETTGIRLDTAYLDDMSITLTKQLDAAQDRIFELAGGPFNIGSPPQLRAVLYDRLGLKPSKKTKTGFSTDASVLESLADEHPIIEHILRQREISKLKSTYIDALPRLVDPATGRLHTRFNQTVATTGRLSSDRPEPAEHPDPHRGGQTDKAGVHPGGGSPAGGGRLLADRAAPAGAPVGGPRAGRRLRPGRRHPPPVDRQGAGHRPTTR